MKKLTYLLKITSIKIYSINNDLNPIKISVKQLGRRIFFSQDIQSINQKSLLLSIFLGQILYPIQNFM